MSDWRASFLNAEGVRVDFDDPRAGIIQTGPIVEAGMPPFVFTSEPVFDLPGEQLRGLRAAVREIGVPIAVRADTGALLIERQRALASRLNPLLGNGTFRIEHDIVASRSITCRYAHGFEGALDTAEWGHAWQESVLAFRSFAPYWLSDENVVEFAPAGTDEIPFFPIANDPDDFGPHFGTSSIYEPLDVHNDGDLDAYPVWTINGPIESPVITNSTTGQIIDFGNAGGLSLADGESATIVTERGAPSVRKYEGTNLFRYLSDGSNLWPLAKGANHIVVSAGGARDTSRIKLAFRTRHLHH